MSKLKPEHCIKELKVGFIYSAVWKCHGMEWKTKEVQCYKVLALDFETGLVKTDRGNRTFNKLTWFNGQTSNFIDYKE